VYAHPVDRPRWYTALEALAPLTASPQSHTPAWTWTPALPQRRPESADFTGTAHPRQTPGATPHVTARALIRHTARGDSTDTAATALSLTPASRADCAATWALGVTAFGILATGDPGYRSTDQAGPAVPPDPAGTDYAAAAATAATALALIDENADFDAARDGDLDWPAGEDRTAVLALRHLRDTFTALRTTASPGPAPVLDVTAPHARETLIYLLANTLTDGGLSDHRDAAARRLHAALTTP
jgi:hypothetical protein